MAAAAHWVTLRPKRRHVQEGELKLQEPSDAALLFPVEAAAALSAAQAHAAAAPRLTLHASCNNSGGGGDACDAVAAPQWSAKLQVREQHASPGQHTEYRWKLKGLRECFDALGVVAGSTVALARVDGRPDGDGGAGQLGQHWRYVIAVSGPSRVSTATIGPPQTVVTPSGPVSAEVEERQGRARDGASAGPGNPKKAQVTRSKSLESPPAAAQPDMAIGALGGGPPLSSNPSFPAGSRSAPEAPAGGSQPGPGPHRAAKRDKPPGGAAADAVASGSAGVPAPAPPTAAGSKRRHADGGGAGQATTSGDAKRRRVASPPARKADALPEPTEEGRRHAAAAGRPGTPVLASRTLQAWELTHGFVTLVDADALQERIGLACDDDGKAHVPVRLFTQDGRLLPKAKVACRVHGGAGRQAGWPASFVHALQTCPPLCSGLP